MSTNATLPRSRANLMLAVLEEDPTQAKYQPHDSDGIPGNETFCNIWLIAVLFRLGLRIPPRLANALVMWFSSAPAMTEGWVECDEAAALAAVDRGEPAVVGWANPHGKHGHVALCVPSVKPGLHIAQAGSRCFREVLVKDPRAFGGLPVRIWRHA